MVVSLSPSFTSTEVRISLDHAAGMETEAETLGSMSARLQMSAVYLAGVSLLSVHFLFQDSVLFTLMSPYFVELQCSLP